MSFNLGRAKGTDGKGIDNIAKTKTEDNVDTYTITYTNGDTQTYTVTNAPLTDNVTSTDNTHSITPKGVYNHVQSIVGDISNIINGTG